jgi:hypothetical protein
MRFFVLAWLGCATACTVTHRYEIPTPVVEPAPPQRLAATVGVRYEAGLADKGQVREIPPSFGVIGHRWVVPVGSSVVTLCDGLAPALFARVVPVPDAETPPGLDAVLDVRLDRFELSQPSGMESNPCRAHVVLSFALASPAGEEIARFDTDATAEQPPGLGGCIGDAIALALQQAGRSFSSDLLASATVRSWMERRGLALETPPPPREESPEPGQEAPPRPVQPRGPLAPRTTAMRFGIGWGVPRGTPGALEDASGGIVLDLGGTYRPYPGLGIDFDAFFSHAEFSSRTAPPAGLFQTKDARMDLNTVNFSLGIRAIAPLGVVEPWAGGGVGLVVSKLTLGGSTLGFPGTVDSVQGGPSAYLAAGLDAEILPKVLFGAQCRWTFAGVSFGDLSASRSASIGGPACLGAGTLTWP